MPAHLLANDVRKLLRLAGECREIHEAGGRASSHFLREMTRLVRSQVAILMSASGLTMETPPVVDDVEDVGWPTSSDRDRVYGYLTSVPIGDDPLSAALISGHGSVVTLMRANVISSHAWARTEVRNDVHRPSGIDDTLLSMARTAREGQARVIALKRGWGERPFTETERELLDLAHGECGWMLDERAPRKAPLPGHWTRRERETLDLLLTGASEKGVAAALGLSPHTVHDYVKSIYRRAGVASRAELMARALAR